MWTLHRITRGRLEKTGVEKVKGPDTFPALGIAGMVCPLASQVSKPSNEVPEHKASPVLQKTEQGTS